MAFYGINMSIDRSTMGMYFLKTIVFLSNITKQSDK